MEDYSKRFRQNKRKPSLSQRIVNGFYNLKVNFSVAHAWFILGVIFVMYGGYNLFMYGHFGSLLSIACGGLITHQSIKQFGGWYSTKRAMINLFR